MRPPSLPRRLRPAACLPQAPAREGLLEQSTYLIEPAAVAQIVLGLTIKEATVLSQAAIAGGALSGALFALFRGHPEDARAPLLDFRMATVLLPVLLLGTNVGAHTRFVASQSCMHAHW